jgi:hypothetical protein
MRKIVRSSGVPESSPPGAFVNPVVGVGATVRRPASAGTGFVGDLLKVFEASGWQNTRLVAARRRPWYRQPPTLLPVPGIVRHSRDGRTRRRSGFDGLRYGDIARAPLGALCP